MITLNGGKPGRHSHFVPEGGGGGGGSQMFFQSRGGGGAPGPPGPCVFMGGISFALTILVHVKHNFYGGTGNVGGAHIYTPIGMTA